MNALSKLFIYAALLLGAALFLLPIVWMVSTSLKPIEQTMAMPPSFVPYAYYVQADGERIPVKKGELIEEPSTIVRIPGDEKRRIVAQRQVEDGALEQRTPQGDIRTIPVDIEGEIPATREAPYRRVLPETEAGPEQPAWLAVPADSIVEKVDPRWHNYPEALEEMGSFGRYLRNTLFLCLMTVIGTVFSSSLAAYGFSRIPWRGRGAVFVICMTTMMIPFPVLLVPLYVLFKTIGWVGTMKPLWVPAFFAFAFNVFLLRQFFMTIPKDLSDAARIDGCGEFRIYWQIILPLCKPALMVVGLFQFIGTWNDFLGPLIYLTDQEQYTLALGLYAFQSQHGGTEWHYLMAASMIVVLPIIILFFLTQKTFIEGISMTGLKG